MGRPVRPVLRYRLARQVVGTSLGARARPRRSAPGTPHLRRSPQWVAANADCVELHLMPAYSPELNPDKLRNADLKRHVYGAKAA